MMIRDRNPSNLKVNANMDAPIISNIKINTKSGFVPVNQLSAPY